MACSFKVKMNTSALNKLSSTTILAIRQTADRMYAKKVEAMEIPFGEGTLQNVLTSPNDAQAKNGIIMITSEGPYAKRLYWHPEFNFNHEFNINAKGEWWEDYLTGRNKNLPSQWFTHYYRKACGGIIK